MLTTASARRCIGKRCADGPSLDGQPGPRFVASGLLCQRCVGRLQRSLAEVPARVTLLRSATVPRRGGGGDGRSSRSAPVPLDLAAHDLLQSLSGVLSSWALLVAQERGAHGPDRMDDPVATSRWLLSQVDWLAGQPWVDDLEEELHDLALSADGVTRVHPAWHSLEPPCPRCDARELGRRDGDERVMCRSCGVSWDERQYRWLVLVLAADPDLSLTTGEVARRAQVEPATVRQWVSRGLLRRAGKVDGQSRFAAAEVGAFLARRAEQDAQGCA